MNRKRFIFLILILLTAFVTGGISAGSAKAADAFRINISVTSSKTSDVYEVHTEITNNGSDFTGTYRLNVASKTSSKVGYDVDISVPSGSTKEYITNVPMEYVDVNSAVLAVIYDKSMKKQYMEKFQGIFNKYTGRFTMGLLSDSPEKLGFIDMGGQGIQRDDETYEVKLEEKKADSLDLDTLDGLVIDDYDTGVLDKKTIISIKNWVNNGGVLILGTGDSAEKVLKGFGDDDVIGLSAGESYEQSVVGGSGDFYQANMLEMGNYNDYNFVSDNSYVKSYGYGCIFVSAFCLGDISKNEDDGLMVMNNIYTGIAPYTSSSNSGYGNTNTYVIERFQGYMEEPAKTGTGLLVFIVTVYVILAGPGIYLILNAMKKREIIWWVIPCLSLLFVGFLFLMSFSKRIRGVTLKTVDIVDYSVNKNETFIIGYNPDPSSWKFEMKDPYITGSVLSCGFYDSNSLRVDGSVKNSGKLAFSFNPASTFDVGIFTAQKAVTSTGSFDINTNFDEDSFYNDMESFMDPTGSTAYNQAEEEALAEYTKGDITNNTGEDMDYVLIYMGQYYQMVENVKNGESIDVGFSYNKSYGYNSDLIEDLAKQEYNNKNYDKAGALAAMGIACSKKNNTSTDVVVIGVKKQDSMTLSHDASWKCYMNAVGAGF